MDPTVTPLRGRAGGSGRGGLADARRYTPRGRTVREAAEERTGTGRGDPFRPALQVLRGGVDSPVRRRTPGREVPPPRATAPAKAAGKAAGKAATKAPGKTSGKAAGKAATKAPRKAATRVTPKAPLRKPRRRPRLGEPRRRLRSATVLTLLLFLVIGGRLVELQLTDARAYAAAGLHDRLQHVPLAAPRGAIYDRDGNILADSVDARYVYADPGLVQRPDAAADALSPLLGVPRSTLLPKLRPHKFDDGTQVRFEWLARGVDVPLAEKVRALNLPGIGIRQDEKREVPGHDLAANVLGFTGQDLAGLVGLEAGYDNVLHGVEGRRTFEIGGGNLGAEIPGGYQEEQPARPGTSLRLTLDRDLQYEVQHILFDRMRQVNATFGSAVVLDVHTGGVLAQASYPTYDAAEPFANPHPQWSDANTDTVVDPGSVAKVLTLGGALQEGVVAPDSTVTVGPTVRKGDQTYRDTHPFPTGTRITLPAVLAYSSNVGTIGIADQLGPQRLYSYQQKFGLGRPTGEGLPGESGGLVQPPDRWSGSSYGSIPIGEGISVTPLQMAAVYAAIANDGVWVQPHLVGATEAPDGKATPVPAAPSHRVLSPEVATALRTMLEAVVTVDGATGRSAALPGYRVAGKTGTGSKVVDGHYVQGEVASFIGMAPADAPRFVIAVFAHTPGGEGGKVAAPAFRDMMAFALSRFHVPPTGTPPPTFVLTR